MVEEGAEELALLGRDLVVLGVGRWGVGRNISPPSKECASPLQSRTIPILPYWDQRAVCNLGDSG